MSALKKIATSKKHYHVLQHMMGYLKEQLATAVKEKVHQSLEDRGNGYVPLIVPITLVKHDVELLEIEYLKDQTYLSPHPKELALRNQL